jgi:hypothetical protein
MAHIYEIGGKQISLDDEDAVRALTPAEFAELVKQAYTNPDPDDVAPEIPLQQPPAGTGFVIVNPPHTED